MKFLFALHKSVRKTISGFFPLLQIVLLLGLPYSTQALPGNSDPVIRIKTSSVPEAIAYLSTCDLSDVSAHWPNIKPELFVRNIKKNIEHPEGINPGDGTYFCGYSAITYLLLQDDPLGYTKFITDLYRYGKATFNEVVYMPSVAVKNEAGLLKYKGVMDIHPADQLWFLTLAGHYKGYLNIFNRRYHPGDENKFWASVNYAKFNRMAKKLLRYDVQSRGTDIFRPQIPDLFSYLTNKLGEGNVVLYINNRIVHKKNHANLKLAVPTHFVALESISRTGDMITLVYWDNGGKTLIQLNAAFLKRIVFGITVFTKSESNAG